jgi:hypothetical protein
MWGKRSAMKPGFVGDIEIDAAAPVRLISRSMARATMSRGASEPRGSFRREILAVGH